MAVSILSCVIDRKTNDLAEFKVIRNNGKAGRYKTGWIIEMAGLSGPINVVTQGASVASTLTSHPLPTLWSTYSYLDPADPAHETDAHSYAKAIKVQRFEKHERFYYVTVDYEPAELGEIPEGGGTPIAAADNPIGRKPKIWWDRYVTSGVDPVSATGEAIKNFANTLYPDLAENDRTKALAVCEVNVATHAEFIAYSQQYDQAVNSSAWTFRGQPIPARNALMTEVSSSLSKTEGATTYFTVAFRIAFAPPNKTWDIPLPEMSQTHFTVSGSSYDLDSDGNRKRTDAGSLVPLNPDGTRRSDDQPVLVTYWRNRREVDFTALSFLNA